MCIEQLDHNGSIDCLTGFRAPRRGEDKGLSKSAACYQTTLWTVDRQGSFELVSIAASCQLLKIE